jgi:aldehyde dehydrogenase (NAD+)
LVEKSIADDLAARLKATVKEFFGENAASSPDFARIVNDRQFSRLAGYLEEPDVAKKIVFGGASKPEDRYMEPTLLRDVPWDSAIAQEEIFGPFLLMQTVKNLDEAIAIINERPKPLALYAFTKDKGTQARLLEETYSGSVCINDCAVHVSNPELPFGGVGESGHGAYHAKASFNAFSHEKSVLVKRFLPDPAVRYPPATPWKERLMRAILDQDFVRVLLVAFGINKQ